MNSLLSMQMLLSAGEMFAASSVIVVLAWLAARDDAASRRHLIWLAAFGALLLFPALAALVPPQFTLLLAAPIVPVTQGLDVATVAAPVPEPTGFSLDAATIVFVLFALWSIGVLAVVARGIVAAFALHGLHRNSIAHTFGHIPLQGPRCELRISTNDECGPVTWGIFRPVILLPKNSIYWPRERLEAVLRHELAHVRRRNSLAQMLSLIVCAFYWPNPLVWIAARNLRCEAEMAADDAVILSGIKPSAYAGELLQIAAEFRAQPLMPLAMAAPSALEAHVNSVLAPTKPRSGVTPMDVFKIACLGMMATTAIAFARPSLAQDAPQPVQSAPLPPADNAAPPQAAPMPTPEAMPAPEARATPSETYVIDTNDNGHHHVHHWNQLSPQGAARIRAQVRVEMAKAKPEIERAMRQVEAARPQIETAMREVEKARPQIEAAMTEAMRANHMNEAQIAAAVLAAQAALARMPNEAQIDAQVARAMAKAHVQIEAMRVRMHDHGEDAVAPEPPDAPEADDAAPEAPAAPPAPPAPPAAPPAPQN